MTKQFMFSLLLGFVLVGMPDSLFAQRGSSRSGGSDARQTQQPAARPAPTAERPARPAQPAANPAPAARPAPTAERPARPTNPVANPTSAAQPTPAVAIPVPATRPSPTSESRTRPTTDRQTPGQRPNTAEGRSPVIAPSASVLSTNSTGPATRPAIDRTPSNRPSNRPELSRVPDTRGWGGGSFSRPLGSSSNRNRPDIRDYNVTRGIVNNVNAHLHTNYFRTPSYTHFFDDRWHQHYPGAWYPVRPIPPRVWWQPAPAWGYTWRWFAAGFLTGYAVDRVLTPMPYYYGTNVYYVNDMVYVNGEPYVPASDYYMQAAEIAARGVSQTPIQITVNIESPAAQPVVADIPPEEWMPMGTFAVLEDPEATTTSTVIQLATNKSGQIAGNVINMQTDEIMPVYGAIDPETQRVAMRIEGREEIAECGLWNLTQDALTVLLHVDAETTEERTLVRLSDSEQEDLAP